MPLTTSTEARKPLVPELTAADTYGNTLAYAPVALRRESDFVILELGVRNITQAGKGQDNANLFWTFWDGGSVSFGGVSLVDIKNRKRHVVVTDSNKKCLCSSFAGGLDVPRGGNTALIVYFAAPPADVTSMDVVLAKKGTFTAVPVS